MEPLLESPCQQWVRALSQKNNSLFFIEKTRILRRIIFVLSNKNWYIHIRQITDFMFNLLCKL